MSVATFFALRLVNNFVDLSVFAVNFVTGLGLGLAIDYSLFIVSRYREEAAGSGFGPQALRRTLETSANCVRTSASAGSFATSISDSSTAVSAYA